MHVRGIGAIDIFLKGLIALPLINEALHSSNRVKFGPKIFVPRTIEIDFQALITF